MSTSSEQDHLDPSNPIYYAPRSLREGTRFRIGRSNDAEPELSKNSGSSPSSFENLLMEAVRKSTGIPLDADGVGEPPRYDNGPGRWMERTRVAWWSAAAVGGLALIALFFVILIPASQSHAPDSNVSGAMESLKTALRRAPPDDPSKPALAEFATGLAIDRAAQPTQPANTHQQSEALLHRFLQWQQKIDSADSRLGSGSEGQGEGESVK
jgi:hypothetical protein